MSRLLLGIAGLVVLLAATATSLCREPPVERELMSEETYEILRNAVIEATEVKEYDPAEASDTMEMVRKEQPERFKRILKRHREEYAKLRKENLEALERLAKQSWPKVSKLEWVHVFTMGAEEGDYFPAWRISDDNKTVKLLDLSFSERTVQRGEIRKIVEASFKADLSEFIEAVQEPEGDRLLRRPRPPYHFGVTALRGAVAAAQHGLEEEAAALVAAVLSSGWSMNQGLAGPYNEMVWEVLRPAMLQFQKGGSRDEFLATCKKLVADFPGSEYDAMLKSWIEPMEREAKAPPDFLKKKPEERTDDEQVRNAVYQLRDVAGKQPMQPGRPMVFTWAGKGLPQVERVLTFGPAAIPHLIAALDDDTPTRTLGFWRDYHPSGYYLLRRSDVAIQCIEKIAKRDFYDSEYVSGRLSVEEPERRAEVIAEVKKWWEQDKDEPK